MQFIPQKKQFKTGFALRQKFYDTSAEKLVNVYQLCKFKSQILNLSSKYRLLIKNSSATGISATATANKLCRRSTNQKSRQNW